MNVLLLEVPYDSGHHRVRMGRGPTHLVTGGAASRLAAAGHSVVHREVSVDSPLPLEMGTGFAVIRAIAAEVAGARARGEFPLVLAGNCNSAVGTVSGLGDASVGILWFDAHGDCETPETTESGYFDGMGLAILAGEAFRGIRASVPGFQVVPGTRVLLLGARQVSDGEHALMRRVGTTYLSVGQLRAGALAPALDRLGTAPARASRTRSSPSPTGCFPTSSPRSSGRRRRASPSPARGWRRTTRAAIEKTECWVSGWN